MGIFSAPVTATTPAVERRKNGVPQGGLSIVAKDLTIAGDLHAAGVVRIEGRVIGNVHAEGMTVLEGERVGGAE